MASHPRAPRVLTGSFRAKKATNLAEHEPKPAWRLGKLRSGRRRRNRHWLPGHAADGTTSRFILNHLRVHRTGVLSLSPSLRLLWHWRAEAIKFHETRRNSGTWFIRLGN